MVIYHVQTLTLCLLSWHHRSLSRWLWGTFQAHWWVSAFPRLKSRIECILLALVCTGCCNRGLTLFSYSFGSWKSKLRVPTVLVSGETSFWLEDGLTLGDGSLVVSSHGLLSAYAQRGISGVSSSFYKVTSPTGLDPHYYDLI